MKKIPYKKILILGSGALQIGQAGEFDYSGSQAIKALKEEGVSVVLINPNIATYQTSENLADNIYFLPINDYFVEQVIIKEKPDGILLSFGGQTALNCGLSLHKKGILSRRNVPVLGSPIKSIELTEDRELFAKHLRSIGIPVPPSGTATNTQTAERVARKIGFPLMVRAAFTLGGQKSGIAHNTKELQELVAGALAVSPQVLLEKYLHHYKEIEYEVVRDKEGNVVTVCNMENVDPLGIHTGDSIVVAPSQTLTNEEYHTLRDTSIKIVESLGIIGECNVQFALNPKPRKGVLDYAVIEVNARLSRSSALASKATGYPLAHVAAKLALGYSLAEVQNKITKTTQSFFEPALDYIVVKMPRWDLPKFIGAETQIGSAMKSVGEVMAIGRNFEEALQKAARMRSENAAGVTDHNFSSKESIIEAISTPTPKRLSAIMAGFFYGLSVNNIHRITGIDRWFLHRMEHIVQTENNHTGNKNIDKFALLNLKQLGFSDKKIALMTNQTEDGIRKLRKKFAILPAVLQIDTLAGEIPVKTNYLYLTYNATENDVSCIGKNAVLVLGSGPYHIGSSVEFDWSCVYASTSLKKHKKKSVIINCNPETVSTDYDMSDRLYFEDISFETVADIYEFENSHGLIISMGGQRPNALATKFARAGFNILGTSAENIDRAENRNTCSAILDSLGIIQPRWRSFSDIHSAENFAQTVGYPILVRPSYVLSGSAMRVCHTAEDLAYFIAAVSIISSEHPITLSKFIEYAQELEYDAVAQNGEIIIFGISEHVEYAGTHSGDATIVYPTQHTYASTEFRINEIAKKIAKVLHITGPFNIQFLVKDEEVMVIEINIRASRTLPFLSKATGKNFSSMAVDSFFGKAKTHKTTYPSQVLVKSPQFSFSRIPGADPIRRVEMSSTGEAACFGKSYSEALLKSIFSTQTMDLNKKTVLLSVGTDMQKQLFLPSAQILHNLGYTIQATPGTAEYLKKNSVPCLAKKIDGMIDDISKKTIGFVINIHSPKKESVSAINTEGFRLRRTAIDNNTPLFTDINLAKAFIHALDTHRSLSTLEIQSYKEYFSKTSPPSTAALY